MSFPGEPCVAWYLGMGLPSWVQHPMVASPSDKYISWQEKAPKKNAPKKADENQKSKEGQIYMNICDPCKKWLLTGKQIY